MCVLKIKGEKDWRQKMKINSNVSVWLSDFIFHHSGKAQYIFKMLFNSSFAFASFFLRIDTLALMANILKLNLEYFEIEIKLLTLKDN